MEIKSTKRFRNKLAEVLDYASMEFGQKTVQRWQEKLVVVLNNLRSNPEMYPFVPELHDVQPNAHGVIVMKNFKVIFVLNSKKQIVQLGDIWDLRQDPDRLRRSWKIIRL